MQIHRVRGRDLREALGRARELHGDAAFVLSHERMPDGAITVAVGLESAEIQRKEPDEPLPDLERVLRRTGCSDDLVGRTVLKVVSSGVRGAYAFDVAARLLGDSVAIAPSPKLSKSTARPLVLAFVGAAGVGKTTTLAKLAVRLVRAGRRIGLVTLDAQRPGASALLRSLAGPLATSLEVAANADELRATIGSAGARDVVLVDTSGSPREDVAVLKELSASLAAERRAGAFTTNLVLAATASRAALSEVADAYAALRPNAAVITKLDETRAPVAALECISKRGLALAFLCDGRDIAAHLHRPDAERIADLFLRGKIA